MRKIVRVLGTYRKITRTSSLYIVLEKRCTDVIWSENDNCIEIYFVDSNKTCSSGNWRNWVYCVEQMCRLKYNKIKFRTIFDIIFYSIF